MPNDSLMISSDYPGGNIKIISINNDSVLLEQDLRGSDKWWFYWNFYTECNDNKDIIFKFTNGEVVGQWGPAISNDGIHWDWLGAESVINKSSFKYSFNKGDMGTYFSFSFPYTLKNFELFYNKYKNDNDVKHKTLTISEQNRLVPLIIIGNKNAKKDMIFTCRHHACESVASYVLEGLMEYFFNHKESQFFNEYRIHIIPFVDLDGVENGEQGKNRIPHDHNRDYIEKSLYHSTAAIMEYVKKLNLTLGIDFHAPHKWGADDDDRSFTNWGRRNEHVFFVKPSAVKNRIDSFSGILHKMTHQDVLKYFSEYDIETTGQNNFTSFLLTQNCEKFACTIETSYAGTKDMIVTPSSLRTFGIRIGEAMNLYLSENE